MDNQTAAGFMQGKRGLIMGVANERSIAWGIAAKLAEQGAELAFTFQGEALQSALCLWPPRLAVTLCCHVMSPMQPVWIICSPHWLKMGQT